MHRTTKSAHPEENMMKKRFTETGIRFFLSSADPLTSCKQHSQCVYFYCLLDKHNIKRPSAFIYKHRETLDTLH